MTTAITKTEVKNSKKGFTLVELVVVIAILAILAAIAIPVVNSIINTASRNGALSNGQTIELAVKECQADITARNDEVYNGTTAIPNAAGTSITLSRASTDNATPITLEMVALAKGISDAFSPVNYNGATFEPYWDRDADKCVYLCTTVGGSDFALHERIDAATPGTGAYANFANCTQLNNGNAYATVNVNTL